MKYFTIQGEIGPKVHEAFIDFVNTYPNDRIHISINSNGGEHFIMLSMVGIINAQPKRFTVRGEGLFSAAFELFHLVECKKEISSSCMGIYHLAYESMAVDMRGKPVWTLDIDKVKEYKKVWLPRQKKFAKSFMSKKQYKQFKKGKDVFFGSKEMAEIFFDAIIVI